MAPRGGAAGLRLPACITHWQTWPAPSPGTGFQKKEERQTLSWDRVSKINTWQMDPRGAPLASACRHVLPTGRLGPHPLLGLGFQKKNKDKWLPGGRRWPPPAGMCYPITDLACTLSWDWISNKRTKTKIIVKLSWDRVSNG